ncbi:MAG: hypothetical protein HYU69_04310 [Bacteroidetes bacterium]|nr:hypothetical protein [Bacteroidota bacterium]
MKQHLLLFFVLFVFAVRMFGGQEGVEPGKKHVFDIAAGTSWSAIDIEQYSQFRRAKPGMHFKAFINVSNSMKVSGEYTLHFTHNDNPSWKNIHSNNIDVNAYMLGDISNSHLGFFAFTGLSLLKWRGDFTGLRDERHDGVLRLRDEEFQYYKLMVNLGIGIERQYKRFSLFAEGKFRFAKEAKVINVVINDVFYCFGVKVPVMLSTGKRSDKTQLNKGGKNRISGDRYHWF